MRHGQVRMSQAPGPPYCKPIQLVTVPQTRMSGSVAGTGPAGTEELESRADWGVSLSLVHLPPGVQLLTYRSGKAGRLQPGPGTAAGDQPFRRLQWVLLRSRSRCFQFLPRGSLVMASLSRLQTCVCCRVRSRADCRQSL